MALLMATASLLSAPRAQPLVGDRSAYRLLSGRPFAGKAEGVVGALGVPTRGLTLPQVRATARQRAQDWDAVLRVTRPRLIDWLIQHGRWRPDQPIGIDALIVPTDRPLPRSRQAFGAGTLSFQFENFPTATEARVRSFLQTALPLLTDLYGPPVTTPPNAHRVVTIVLDEGLQALDGGVYDAATDTIRLPEFVPTRGYDWFNLLHQVLHAFRGPLLLSFPAWEEGMARAAALLAAVQLRGQGVAELSQFDPKDPINGDPLWVLPLYDVLNQPPLGNPTFLPPSGYQPMAFWRIGMSAAAWLKVAAENPQCFRQFNGALLAQPDPATLRGDTVALVDLMRTIVPTVEGQDFRDWYRRQFVLDTGVSVGPKLYAFAVPLHTGILLVLNHYRTVQVPGPSGGVVVDEQPFTGVTAQLRYRNDQSDDLAAEEGNEAMIVDGEGFIAPQFFNIGGANLIFVDVFANNLALTVPFPYMVRGEEPNENPLWGGVLNALGGTVRIRFNDAADLAPVTVQRGVFAVTQGVDLGTTYRLRLQHTADGMAESTEWRNGAFDFYCLIVRARPSVVTLQVALPAGIHLFTVPLFPTVSDEAAALGLPPDQLLLARWNPTRPGDVKYELYPRITTAMAPGVGYWLRLLQDTTLQVQGTPVPNGEPYQVPLFGGWNQLGNPYNRDLPVGEIQAMLGTEGPVDLNTAQQRQWLQATVWVWDPQQRRYQIAETVRTWQGFWIRALRPGVRLIFGSPRLRAHRQVTPSATPSPSPQWTVQLMVTTDDAADTENRFGVLPAGATPIQVVKPPIVPDSVWAAFVPTDGTDPLAHDFRPNGTTLRWHFIVTNGLAHDTQITLRWNGVSSVPRTVQVWLTDTATGERLSLRQRSHYTFTARAKETRRFTFEAVTVSAVPLVRIIGVQPLRGRGLLVRLATPAPVQVQAEVRTLAGRLVHRFAERFIGRAPVTTLSWNGRDATGALVPAGPYLITVAARTDDGREQRAVQVVMLR